MVAVAESCTGGLIAAAITENPGSSGYFLGGVVAYSNDAKTAFLDVPPELLAEHGAVSREVAVAMATGARARFGADLAAAVTGVAGPEGGTLDKPVGMVYFGVSDTVTANAMHKHFQAERAVRDRVAIRESAAFRALVLLHAAATQGLR